jgi:hypothetical protein
MHRSVLHIESAAMEGRFWTRQSQIAIPWIKAPSRSDQGRSH